ncbi:MAG: formimidoylglutamate deiminase [Pseudomonadota bacterium]|nr:formimidoylglutamate deiminase [Pseudomonadota bacterium]
MTAALFADTALLPTGWAENVRFDIADNGDLTAVTADAKPHSAERVAGPVIPGMANLHSHAFQRAMAGLAERAGPLDDSFWTWRQVMYGFVGRLSPDTKEAIAAQLYVEMLKAGYTAVGEFHYLHHGPDGSPHDDPAETSRRIIAAAQATGIGLTHLPVLYAHGGFGGAPASPGQRRFLHNADGFMALVEGLSRDHSHDPQIRIGMALHSLRAVTPELISETTAALDALDGAAPIHIHIAEQQREVDDCLAWSGARPVEWLLDNAAVSRRWCLVHATHMTGDETLALARSGAIAGLCPTTEANLGDGLFPLFAYIAAGGALGIGSDSHVSISPVEELRWLEYGQRLIRERRNIMPANNTRFGAEGGSVGAALWRAALAGGARALARPIGAFEPGARADLLVLDGDHPQLAGRDGDVLLDSLVFSGNTNPICHVMVGGRWLVQCGEHRDEEAIVERYREAVATLG